MNQKYDSTQDTELHICEVAILLAKCATEILQRGIDHDRSKIHSWEKGVYDEYTPKLINLTYGSEKYKQCLKEMETALGHHYAENAHHPEHYINGIRGMNLLDVLEMFCDWKAATLRHKDGDIRKSIEINQKRFCFSDELKQIFINTVDFLDKED